MVTKLDASRIHLGDAGIALPGHVYDQRRTRTAWFEGQHVTAAQFNRDQSYHVTRAADLGRAIGRGVVEGLTVRAAADSATALAVDAGLGLASSGEAIALPQPARIDLADIPTQRSVNAMLKPGPAVTAPPEARTGLYVLAASVVEYSSNPIGSYPVSATSARQLEDSVINEAVLFTLSAFPVPVSSANADDWRAIAAYRIFVDGAEPDLPPSSLPLAMVALEGNRILWVDGPMVRRAVTAPGGDLFGLGLVDAARAAAHFEQYDALVADALARDPLAAFAAADRVRALPPVGRLPLGAVALRAGGTGLPARLSQNWLPPSVPVELVALPEDEIEAVLRENMHLPPIDLTASDKVLANTPVTVIVPVARADWAGTPAEVAETALPLVAPPAVGGAPSTPADLLAELISGTPAPAPADTALTEGWVALLARSRALWYARRRQFQRSEALLSGTVLLPSGPPGQSPIIPGETIVPAGEARIPTLPGRVDRGGGLSEAALEGLTAPLFMAHTRLGLDGQFDTLRELPQETLTDVLVHQQQLAAEGAETHAAALTIEIVEHGLDPRAAMERYRVRPLARLQTFAALEPAIVGGTRTVRVAATGDGALPRPAVALVARLSGTTAAVVDSALARGRPLLVPVPVIEDADALAALFDTGLTPGPALSFERDAMTEKTAIERRVRLATSRAIPALGDRLFEAEPEERAKLLPAIAKLVEQTEDPKELGAALARLVGGRL